MPHPSRIKSKTGFFTKFQPNPDFDGIEYGSRGWLKTLDEKTKSRENRQVIESFVFSEGRPVSHNLELEALRLARADKGLILWIDITDPTPEETKEVLEKLFEFHPLAIEDCVTLSELPKIEDYEDYLFMIMHSVDITPEKTLKISELNLFLGKEFLVTFHREVIPGVSVVKDRLVKGTGQQARGADRLAHQVLDHVADSYLPVVEALTEDMEVVEEKALSGSGKEDLAKRILRARRRLSSLRQALRPQREVISRLARGESKIVRALMLPYFRDVQDALTRVDERLQGCNDRMMVAFDVYTNRSAHEANEGIKVLTALTAVTIPPVVVGSWYGMNFRHMPELDHPHGYLTLMGVTLALMVGMGLWLKFKRWF
jgi:magnesium transporter